MDRYIVIIICHVIKAHKKICDTVPNVKLIRGMTLFVIKIIKMYHGELWAYQNSLGVLLDEDDTKFLNDCQKLDQDAYAFEKEIESGGLQSKETEEI